MYTGPNTVNDGLVFGYDTGYGVADNDTATRFYPGALTTNIVPLDLSNSSWFNEYSGGRTLRSETLFGQPSYEFKSNDGQIWVSPFAFNSYDRSSNDLTLSVYAKNIGSSAVSMNTYFGGDYSTDSLGNSNNKSLPADNTWRRYSWTRFSSAMGANYLEFRTANTDVVISCPQLQIGRVATPIVDGSRSSTESLIDLTKTTDIDVSNVSFDSTGQLEFDGTDDYIPLTGILNNEDIAASSQYTINMWLNCDSYGTKMAFSTGQNGNNRIYYWTSNSQNTWRVGNYTSTTGHSSLPSVGNWFNTTLVINGTNIIGYLNGVEDYTGSYTGFNTQHYATFGRHGASSSYYFDGKIANAKIYNLALSADEIKQNYNAYKNRFNI